MIDKIFYSIQIYVCVYIQLHTTFNYYLCAHLVHIYGSFTYEGVCMYIIFLRTFYMIMLKYYDKLNICLNVCVFMYTFIFLGDICII